MALRNNKIKKGGTVLSVSNPINPPQSGTTEELHHESKYRDDAETILWLVLGAVATFALLTLLITVSVRS